MHNNVKVKNQGVPEAGVDQNETPLNDSTYREVKNAAPYAIF